MRRVVSDEADHIKQYFERAAQVADEALCKQAKCGTVIVKDGQIIGEGFNGPPLNDENRRTCGHVWDYSKKPKYDLTCCVHAEWRAVIDACKRNSDKIDGSVLYFMRIDEDGSFTDAGQPFCTSCSRFTMEAGIGEFALWNDNGADIYTLSEYDKLSYDFYEIQ